MNVLWSEPTYLVSKYMHSFLDLFSDDDKKQISDILSVDLHDDNFYFEMNVLLKNYDSNVSLCILPIEDQFLIFVCTEEIYKDLICSDSKDVFQLFMHMIKTYTTSEYLNGEYSLNTQFDSIQKLNNELINTKRLLQKANNQLNVLNEELNNRLVKDALTGLVSRYQYREEMQRTISEDPNKKGVFMFIDIDDFKSVNDRYGHRAGDEYLIEFSNRLRKLTFENSILMRISGDEFGVFIYGYKNIDVEDLFVIWEQVKDEVSSLPITIKDQSIPLSISCGMAIFGIHTKEIFELIDYADFAMYQAKINGKNAMTIFERKQYVKAKGLVNQHDK